MAGVGTTRKSRQRYPPKLDGVFLHRQVYQTTRFLPHDNDDRVINQKIKSAFSMLNDTFPLKGIIFQFWAPVRATTSGKLLLSTSVQPFAFASVNRSLRKYRNFSVKCRYSIYNDDNNINKIERQEEEGESIIIINGGLPAVAFLKRFPEVVFDLKSFHQRNPLVSFALKCDLTCSLMLPVFYQTSSCVGVVECSMNLPGLPVVFNELKDALKSVGLSIYHGIQHTTIEIEKALDMLCESQDFTLGQVIDDGDDDEDDDDHVIVTLYDDDATLFLLPSSSTLSLAKEKIIQDFRLDPALTYKLEYEANEGQWFSLNDDTCFKSCIFFRRKANKNHVKLRVQMIDRLQA